MYKKLSVGVLVGDRVGDLHGNLVGDLLCVHLGVPFCPLFVKIVMVVSHCCCCLLFPVTQKIRTSASKNLSHVTLGMDLKLLDTLLVLLAVALPVVTICQVYILQRTCQNL